MANRNLFMRPAMGGIFMLGVAALLPAQIPPSSRPSEGARQIPLQPQEKRSPMGEKSLSTWISQRVAAWQPTERELSWQRIGWASNIAEAEHLASLHKRPVFLFTLDGHMGAGRC